VKNVFVFAALVFARGSQGTLFEGRMDDVRRTMYAFGAFCLGASAIYLLNDVMDVESDRAHPSKRNRPIAAGLVSIPVALGLSAACVALALFLAQRAEGEPVRVLPVVPRTWRSTWRTASS